MPEKNKNDFQLPLFNAFEESEFPHDTCASEALERPQGQLNHPLFMSELKTEGGTSIFLHPKANRYIRLQSYGVGYELQHKRRRSLGLFVSAEGASVSAPRWVGQSEIDQFLHEKTNWLLRKLKEQKDKHVQRDSLRVRWEAGGELPYMGRILTLRLNLESDAINMDESGKFLNVGCLGSTVSAQFLQENVQTWIKQQALRLFSERCCFYAPAMDVKPQAIKLTSASTRWGSASAQGVIRLHWRLMEMSLDVIDYVVVHELAHLVEMNHGSKFWSLVGRILPDYKQRQQQLKNKLLPVW